MTRIVSQPRRRTSGKAPLPSRIAPMMATLGRMPRDQEHYAFEYKWDGVRAICYCDRGTFRIESRNLLDITRRYPELDALKDALCGRSAVVDGEIVALDDVDRPNFGRLQQRMHLNDPDAIRRATRDVPIIYFIFDLLYLDGRPTMHLPYARRRELLEELTLAGPSWQRTPAEFGHGDAMLESAKRLGMEGLVAKKLDSRYEPGRRSAEWIKIKLIDRQEFVIGGWTPETGTINRLGALLVGYFDPPEPGTRGPGAFRYAGKVGSGFNQDWHDRLVKLLKSNARDAKPFADKVPKPNARWVEPRLVAEVEFRGWTSNNMLRQPAFKGLRTDKEACEVIREGR